MGNDSLLKGTWAASASLDMKVYLVLMFSCTDENVTNPKYELTCMKSIYVTPYGNCLPHMNFGMILTNSKTASAKDTKAERLKQSRNHEQRGQNAL